MLFQIIYWGSLFLRNNHHKQHHKHHVWVIIIPFTFNIIMKNMFPLALRPTTNQTSASNKCFKHVWFLFWKLTQRFEVHILKYENNAFRLSMCLRRQFVLLCFSYFCLSCCMRLDWPSKSTNKKIVDQKPTILERTESSNPNAGLLSF